MKKVFLFDVDGTIVESGQTIQDDIAELLNQVGEKYELGIVGGGTLEKVISQFHNKVKFDYYFTECGCVFHKFNKQTNIFTEIVKKNIRNHLLFKEINILIKKALHFLSQVDYLLSGHFIDLRHGIVYISLIGLSATQEERGYFLELDSQRKYRETLLHILHEKAKELGIQDRIDIVKGGAVGIAIYPSEYDKIQILEHFSKNDYELYYFGDKYAHDGNDYKLIHSPCVKGVKIDSLEDTKIFLQQIVLND